MIKPANFDANKKYPVFMTVYGGPGSQEVMDEWGGSNYLWFQMLAQQGYMIACVDNRGTGARGRDFRTCTYKQLGKLEVDDQIDAAKYLGTLPFVDKNRIGIFGWSYGVFPDILLHQFDHQLLICLIDGAKYLGTLHNSNQKFQFCFYQRRGV